MPPEDNLEKAQRVLSNPGKQESGEGSDDKASKEVEFFAESKRSEARANTLNWALILLVRVLVICGLIVLVVRIWHLIGPTCWYWLSAEQLQTIDHALFSGTAGGIVGKYLMNAFPSRPK